MDLQTWVYSIAIVYMLLCIVFLIAAIAVLYKIYTGVKKAPQAAENVITSVIQRNKVELLSMVGIPVVTMLLGKVRKKIFGK